MAVSEEDSPVRVEREDGVGIIELNRPAVLNCVSSAVIDGIGGALESFEQDAGIGAVLLCAAGDHFCTGADLDEVTSRRGDKAALAAFIDRGHQELCRLEASPLPIVAAVQGLCLAGGLELMMACDVVFAGEGARFGDQHSRYGLIPGWGGTQRLPRLVGRRRALDLMFSARWIGAAEAEAWGLVNYVSADGDLRVHATDYCRDLAAKSGPGLAAMKRLAREGLRDGLAEGLRAERETVPEALLSEDVAEGLAAFSERRQPRFGARRKGA